ncbi:hypothetical protein UP10_26835 [Bradyrhizobium sp. LTSPM299]|nr:hypothetical protein UP09_17165 [Bradyrhizobium sp. LTSP885]KJC57817.1 hypothetical protein UP10_26835 [Bradyrhizobium sp. LTSPM299]
MEAGANPRNLKGFLVAFKAILMSQAAFRGGTGAVIDAPRRFRLIIQPVSAVHALHQVFVA